MRYYSYHPQIAVLGGGPGGRPDMGNLQRNHIIRQGGAERQRHHQRQSQSNQFFHRGIPPLPDLSSGAKIFVPHYTPSAGFRNVKSCLSDVFFVFPPHRIRCSRPTGPVSC